MAELPFDDDGLRVQWIEPDERGGVLRTRYRGTQDVLDQNAALRNDTPRRYGKGIVQHKARVPVELYEQWTIELGRQPTAEECLEIIERRGLTHLLTRRKRS